MLVRQGVGFIVEGGDLLEDGLEFSQDWGELLIFGDRRRPEFLEVFSDLGGFGFPFFCDVAEFVCEGCFQKLGVFELLFSLPDPAVEVG